MVEVLLGKLVFELEKTKLKRTVRRSTEWTTGRTGRSNRQEVPGQRLGRRLGSVFINTAVNDLGRRNVVTWGAAGTAASREELSGAWLGDLAKTKLRGV